MKVLCISDEYPVSLIKGKEYEVIGIENGWYRIIDEDGVDEDEEMPGYLYSPENFKIVEE